MKLDDFSPTATEDMYKSRHALDERDAIVSNESLPRSARVAETVRSEVKYKEVTLTQPGSLASVLGNEIYELDSLIVHGPLDAADFYTMWRCSFYGGLTVLNLEDSSVQGKIVPKNAFWYQSEQYTPGSDYIDCIPLRRIMLPDDLEEIGESAFAYAIGLEEINIPSSIRKIKRRCFSDCIRLNINPLIIPEGVEELGNLAFVNCKSLIGKVVLPTTLKKINEGVFFSAKITECNFPEGLEEIGDAAFYATRLKEAILPNSCQTFTGTDHFALNYELEKVRFPEGLTTIPSSFVENCIVLKEFLMPNSIEVIEDRAFWQCGSLPELQMPPNLRSIGTEALYYCKSLKSISFPATVEYMGAESCECWKRVEKIYCEADIPPVCINSEINPGWTPFGEYGNDFFNRTPQTTPIYVPIGSAESYRNAWGWSYFDNFIETDSFPSASIDNVLQDSKPSEVYYDLFGRICTNPIPGHLYIRGDGKKELFMQ